MILTLVDMEDDEYGDVNHVDVPVDEAGGGVYIVGARDIIRSVIWYPQHQKPGKCVGAIHTKPSTYHLQNVYINSVFMLRTWLCCLH